jgi:hypothetical protein
MIFFAEEPRYISASVQSWLVPEHIQMCGIKFKVAGREAKVAIPPGHDMWQSTRGVMCFVVIYEIMMML